MKKVDDNSRMDEQENEEKYDTICLQDEMNEDEESNSADTEEELIRKKANNEFKANGNFATIQIFMQNPEFKDGEDLRQILDSVNKKNNKKKYNLENEIDCAEFFCNYKNKDYITLAIIFSVFNVVYIGDLYNLKNTLMECLPPLYQLDQEGKQISEQQTDPYLSLSDVIIVIGGKKFITKDGEQCVGYGEKCEKILKNIWTQFPALRESIVTWLLKVNDLFECRTEFDAYQITAAFVRVIAETIYL